MKGQNRSEQLFFLLQFAICITRSKLNTTLFSTNLTKSLLVQKRTRHKLLVFYYHEHDKFMQTCDERVSLIKNIIKRNQGYNAQLNVLWHVLTI